MAMWSCAAHAQAQDAPPAPQGNQEVSQRQVEELIRAAPLSDQEQGSAARPELPPDQQPANPVLQSYDGSDLPKWNTIFECCPHRLVPRAWRRLLPRCRSDARSHCPDADPESPDPGCHLDLRLAFSTLIRRLGAMNNHLADGCNVFPFFAYGVDAKTEFVGTPD